MPRRSNTFQDGVAIVQRHLAGPDVTVEESVMLPSACGEREVDVLLTGAVSGHRVRVAVEASKTGRRADVTWIDSMKGKHDDLATDKLVLYSGHGFTKGARAKATALGITVVTPGNPRDDVTARVLQGLSTVWAKMVRVNQWDVTLDYPPVSNDHFVSADEASGPLLYYEDGGPVELDSFHFRCRTGHQWAVATSSLRANLLAAKTPRTTERTVGAGRGHCYSFRSCLGWWRDHRWWAHSVLSAASTAEPSEPTRCPVICSATTSSLPSSRFPRRRRCNPECAAP